MKKTLLTIACIVLFLASSNTDVLASTLTNMDTSPMVTANPSPRSTENTWLYRTVNGKLQKRLWSYTYRTWLTDWIWV